MGEVNSIESFLTHHGVKGMKWGVTRDLDKGSSSSGSSVGSSGSTTASGPAKAGGRRTALEAGYIKKGHSLEDAELKAAKRAKVEKMLLIAGAVTLAGAAVYVGRNEHSKRFTEVLLKEGTELRNINALGDKANLNRRTYTTFLNSDTQQYRGVFATFLQRGDKNTKIYETVLTAKEEIRAPSHKQAEKLYKEMITGLNIPGVHPTDYKTFNQGFVNDDNGAAKAYFKYLKDRGYNAVLDSNDQFMSGYNTKKPLILFNAASSTVKTGQTVLDQKKIDGLYTRQAAKAIGKSFLPTAALGAAAIGAHKVAANKSKYAAVNAYLIEHPNTKRSHAEIYASLQAQKDGTYTVGTPVKASTTTKKGSKK